MMRNALMPLAALFLLAAAPEADDDVKSDREKFQGTWRIVSLESDGKMAPVEGLEDQRMTFSGDKYVQKVGDQVVERGTQLLDPKKTPKTMDITITEGNDEGKVQLGIYEFDGETLRICVGHAGDKDRPTEFSTKPDSKTILFVFKRDRVSV